MKGIFIFLVAACVWGCSNSSTKQLDNTFYVFNNAIRMSNAPQEPEAQAKFIKELGFGGFSGHYVEPYFPRRAALDKVGLAMPEIYWPVTINEDGTVGYKEGLHELIKDSDGKNLVVALAAFGKPFMEKKEEGDKYLVKAIQELADYADPYKVKIAVYPHVGFYCERLDHSIEIAKMVDRDNVGAIFNTCHLFKVEGSDGWEQKLVNAIPYLYMISINGLDAGNTKDMGWDQLIQPLGEGTFDTYEIVKLAKDNGYEGLFGLQCYNIKQDCEVALKKSIDTWHGYQERYAKGE